ncbi:MAG: hypothetical protein O9274_07090 [Limnobacter sp.]|uniref:hypothetical protein n=1 Tax=Limnobacter sp. TaxID=2003368 RepID=UPI0022C33D7A|nr:hypothetical protein [Limnobacter sp.]MCZ8015447.1 hypothetical protein [Limnobacter sp.]
MLNTRLGGAPDDFVFAAHVVSLSAYSQRVLFRFSMQDELDETIKFNPRFFQIVSQGSNSRAIPVKPQRAWVTPFCIFLQIPVEPKSASRWVIVPASVQAFLLLRVCLNRLSLDDNPDKPSLLAYFWRMNVLR